MLFTALRFGRLWEELGAAGDFIPAFIDLRSRWDEPHRAYHTLGHLEHCLAEFDIVRDQLENPAATEFALCLHDIFEETHQEKRPAIGNVGASAEYAGKILEDAGLDADFVQLVKDHVMATAHNPKLPPPYGDSKYVVDIDLSIFGQPEIVFDKYERNIREEYAHVPRESFRVIRRSILLDFYRRESIYHTEHFRTQYEEQARKNLARSLEALNS